MSRIYLHEEGHDKLAIHGSERALAQITLQHLFIGLLALDAHESPEHPAWQRRFFGKELLRLLDGAYGHAAKERAELMLCSGFAPQGMITVDGKDIDPFMLMLNTGIAAGSAPIQFLARLHGSCEIHCWVDGPDRAWLAQIIETGYQRHILRKDVGWLQAVAAMRARSTQPMVFSYSVSDSFPNEALAKQGGYFEEFEIPAALHAKKQWACCMNALRADDNNPTLQGFTRQLKPNNWNQYSFGHSMNVFDLQHQFELSTR